MENDDLTKKFLRLKKSIQEEENQLRRMEGELEVHKKELKAHGCSSIEKAKEKLSELKSKILSLEKDIQERFEKIEKILEDL